MCPNLERSLRRENRHIWGCNGSLSRNQASGIPPASNLGIALVAEEKGNSVKRMLE